MKKIFLLATLLLATCFVSKADPTNYLTFNGTDQYVDIPTTDDLSMTSTQSLSISYWVKASNSANTPRVFSNRYNMGKNYGSFDIFYGTSGCAIMFISTDGSNPMDDFLGGTAGAWTHIVAVFNRTDGSVQAYCNGSEVSLSRTLSTTDLINTPVNTTLGAGLNDSGTLAYYLEGGLANIRFYRGALTSAEALEDMNANSYSALSSDLQDMCVAAYDLTDSYESLTLTDATGRGNDGTLINYADPSADSNINSITVSQNTNLTGRTNEQDVIVSANISFEGASKALQSMSIDLDGTTSISDINKVRIYGTGNVSSFDERYITSDATLLAEVDPAEGTIVCDLSSATLSAGSNYIWVTVEVADDAVEGNEIDASILSVTTSGGETTVSSPSPAGSREIILAYKPLHTYGDIFSEDGESHSYRIPAMDILPNGNIVTAFDVRTLEESDLPNDISIYAQISEDNGYTWSTPYPLALGGGTTSTGRGDAALLTLGDDTLLATFVGDNGLSASTESSPIRQFMVKSFDGGLTWEDAISGGENEITSVVFDNMNSSKKAAFIASGRGIILERQTGENSWKNGRIMFVTAAGTIGSLENYAVYSDDNGDTWNLSEQAYSYGDESKVVELNDGTILMSVRRSGARGYVYSYDGGETWSNSGTWSELATNACNGDIMEYTCLNDGYSINRTIQSLPTNDGGLVREKITMYISYDEGQSWSTEKQLFDTPAAYSTMIKFPDGTIGMYAEQMEQQSTPCQITLIFLRFSLDWMTSGKDKYLAPGILSAATPTFSPISGTSVEVGGTMTVTISCATENSTIYYTTDGSIPTTENGTVYTGEITVSGGDMISAIAVAEGYESSSVATASYPVKGYCTLESQTTVTYRYLNSVSFAGGEESFTVSGIESATTRDIYKDLTSNILVAEAGATITPTIDWEGEWMHGYIYIDYNNDSEFTAVLEDNGAAASDSELVSFTYYEYTGVSGTGVNSLGTTTANNSRLDNVPSFTLPSDLAAGTYRLRVNIDWNCIDACGTSDIAANAGSITDFTLRIDAPTGVESVYGDNISVTTSKGTITVKGDGAVAVKVFNTQGGVVKDTVITNSGDITIAAGVYLVQINGKTSKVVVK